VLRCLNKWCSNKYAEYVEDRILKKLQKNKQEDFYLLFLFLDWFEAVDIKTLKSSNLLEERQNSRGFYLTTEFYYVRWAVKNQVSCHEADHDHVPEAKNHILYWVSWNYDKTLVQAQINFNRCSLSLSITITNCWSVFG